MSFCTCFVCSFCFYLSFVFLVCMFCFCCCFLSFVLFCFVLCFWLNSFQFRIDFFKLAVCLIHISNQVEVVSRKEFFPKLIILIKSSADSEFRNPIFLIFQLTRLRTFILDIARRDDVWPKRSIIFTSYCLTASSVCGDIFPWHYLLQKDIVFVRMTNSGISCFNRDLVAQVPPIKKRLAACLNT